ncbi:MAG: CDP-diacylglycerol--glycerol-3-phosphate 3-phosphatidyltransferase [Lentisphaerae bacterium]|nr:CDP-diacylglycerol--glycerol-3-phosphate 3-phosphatidyltransferase [Lentisphaerota bacterium]
MKMLSFRMIPNYLTMSRIVLIFVFVILANIRSDMPGFFIPQVSDTVADYCHIIAYVVAILAALTDFFDGFLARKFHLESDFGRLMDPLADKIFVVGTFVTMAEFMLMPGWIIIVVLTREFMVTGLRMLATKKGIVISADKWGKLKTTLQMIVLAIGGFAWAFGEKVGFTLVDTKYWKYWYMLLLLMTFVTLASGVGYFIKNQKIFEDCE